MDIERTIGADIIMAFDECPPANSEYKYALDSMNLTHRWLDRCFHHFNATPDKWGHTQNLFPIVQGAVHHDLRKASCEYIASKNATGNAIGGLSVGEPEPVMYEICQLCCEHLPKDKPRYLMGVGTPWNILECISLGIDMFDCVMPTRNGRNAMLFTSNGVINIDNKKWEKDFSHFLLSILITPLLVKSIAFLPLRVGITQSNMSMPSEMHSRIFHGVPTPIK